MEKRKSIRHRILVDIEIARPGQRPCAGYACNLGREGVEVVLNEGRLPEEQRSVILNFKIWTGTETLFRKLHARVIRVSGERVALVFAERDAVTEAVIQDLIFYQRFERRRHPRGADHAMTARVAAHPPGT